MIINAKKKKKPPVFSLEVNKLNKEGQKNYLDADTAE